MDKLGEDGLGLLFNPVELYLRLEFPVVREDSRTDGREAALKGGGRTNEGRKGRASVLSSCASRRHSLMPRRPPVTELLQGDLVLYHKIVSYLDAIF